MAKCGEGHRFRSTVGTFRFLNELVKLVSPKYLSAETDARVRAKILDLLLLWTVQYPKEGKIKEAYHMLLRQGVVHDPPNPVSIQKQRPAPAAADCPLQRPPADPTSLKIKQLIQSKNPDRVDVHAANLMIQNYYEVEKKKALRMQEMSKGRENVAVLHEMMEHFSVSESSADDVALIRELYGSCKALQPTILMLTANPEQEERVMRDALETNDLLVQALQKYESIMAQESCTGAQRVEAHDDELIDMTMNEGGTIQQQQQDGGADTANTIALEDIFGIVGETPPLIAMNLPQVLLPENLTSAERRPPRTSVVKGAAATTNMDLMISEMLLKATNSSDKFIAAPTLIHDFKGVALNVDAIEPATDLPPRIILNDQKGLKVTLNFTKEHPRDDLAVIVATVANLSPETVTDIELSLQPASGGDDCQAKVLLDGTRNRLAGVKRFRAAIDDLVLVILVSNPKRVDLPACNITVEYCIGGVGHRQALVVADLPNLF